MDEPKKTKIAVIYAGMDVAVGEVQSVYGVPCTHEVKKVNGEELHLAVAEVDADLAKEMIKLKRAKAYADAIK